VLWEAHAPAEATELGTGDGLWDEGEHTPAAVRRDEELSAAADEPPAANTPDDAVQYPVDIPGAGDYGEITLWCPECLLPAGHPETDDPVTWCDCQPGDDPCPGTCKQRAHAPVECPHYVPDEPNGPDGMAAEHPDDVDPDAAQGGGPHVPDEPEQQPETDSAGPFDRTMDLSDLRDKIEQALDTDTLDDLYDAHCAVHEGGDGLWTDDLNALAQARYDELAAGQGAVS
jgi:hypothetical protein